MATADFITGFLAGEASFTVHTRVRDGSPRIKPVLSVIIHEKDEATLEAIQSFFDGVGAIYDHREDCKNYQVKNQEGVQKVVEKLDQCDTWKVTEKYDQYQTWKKLVELYTEEYHTPRSNMREMAELARDELNVGLGKSEESWDEFIDQV
jgi:hypothetical protein